ncbi:MAG: ergothioneine biosynthesis protein EgtB [Rubrivivax sp.]
MIGTEPALAGRYAFVRRQTEALADGLSEADAQVQSMPDASPVKWHLAHTTWFFETFVLEQAEHAFRPFHPAYRVLFNSYYNGIGEQHPRPQRGLVTRPSLAEVLQWRRQVDERVQAVLARGADAALRGRIELGLQHEQQHQELILTDLLHLLSCNPLEPAYRPAPAPGPRPDAGPLSFEAHAGGVAEIGHAGEGFAFDNESPRHRVFLEPFAIATRLVNCGEWLDFVADGGYAEPRWWLSAGWDAVRRQAIEAPLYWRRSGGAAFTHRFGLHGRVPLDPAQPVAHVSLYEADAFARWWSAQHPGHAPLQLPTEAQWEHVAAAHEARARSEGRFLESGRFEPADAAEAAPRQLMGQLWQWTVSAYQAYPGFVAWEGAVGEYNAKFMVDQYVLRGGSFATPRGHIRASYRNFFPSGTRWQFSGVRLVHAP